MTEQEEKAALRKLTESGFVVIVSNPHAARFDEKYTAYKPIGRLNGDWLPLNNKGEHFNGTNLQERTSA